MKLSNPLSSLHSVSTEEEESKAGNQFVVCRQFSDIGDVLFVEWNFEDRLIVKRRFTSAPRIVRVADMTLHVSLPP